MKAHLERLPLLALAVIGIAACGGEDAAPDPTRSGGPIVVISIDTLRADRLPAWGYEDLDTPAIDSLVKDGVRFESAWSHVPLTLPSHISMFTGQLPGEHGVRDNLGYTLSSEQDTLASILSREGYTTAGMVSAWVLRKGSGVDRGFQVWNDGLETASATKHQPDLQRIGDATVTETLAWLGARPGGDRFLLFVHLFDPHAPYDPPEPYRSRYENRYDGEIAAADAAVGRLLDALRDADLYDDATIILLSDHGEGLNDHGEAEHGIFLYREAIHVPLVVKLPSSELSGTTVSEPVQLIDVFPTVLEAAGIEATPRGDAISLVAIANGSANLSGRRVFSESMYPRLHLGWSELESLTDGDVHVIDAPSPELYRMTTDPAEVVNLVGEERRLFAEYRDQIDEISTPFSPPAPVSAEAAAKLTALGYLGSGPANVDGPLPDPKSRIDELQKIKDAWVALHEGRVAEAIAIYEAVVESSPQLADAWIQLSMAYERSGAIENAIRASQRAIQVSPSLSQGVAITIARLQLELGDLEGAEEHAELAAPVSPEESKLILARVALTRKQLDRALSLASDLMNEDRFRARAVVIAAQAEIERDNYQGALDLLQKERERLLESGQALPSLFEFARADALIRLGRIEEGIAAFRSEIEHHPGDLDAYSRLAAIYVLSGRVSMAIEVIEELVTNNPVPRSYDLAVTTFERLGREDLAEQWRRRRAANVRS